MIADLVWLVWLLGTAWVVVTAIAGISAVRHMRRIADHLQGIRQSMEARSERADS